MDTEQTLEKHNDTREKGAIRLFTDAAKFTLIALMMHSAGLRVQAFL